MSILALLLQLCLLICWICFFLFKQKTAYEMRISDWSSDVCSSDLQPFRQDAARRRLEFQAEPQQHAILVGSDAQLQAVARRRREEGFAGEDGEEVAERHAGQHVGGMVLAGLHPRPARRPDQAGEPDVAAAPGRTQAEEHTSE